MMITKRVTEHARGTTYEVVVTGHGAPREAVAWSMWVPRAAGQEARDGAVKLQDEAAQRAASRPGVVVVEP